MAAVSTTQSKEACGLKVGLKSSIPITRAVIEESTLATLMGARRISSASALQ